ncbi:MAG: hypothetical protein BGP25_05485 [Lysobacterales bacterium 63-13]|nr:MAG: hypothetical protein BGP25_05485 [Xanthomonadales bacterium 63-13]
MQGRYYTLFRPAFERVPAIAWLLTAVMALLQLLAADAPIFILLGVAALSLACAFPWCKRWFEHAALRRRLKGTGLQLMKDADFAAHIDPEGKKIYIGEGFRWSHEVAQIAQEVARADSEKLSPPTDIDAPGQAWMHGIGERYEPIYLPVTDEHTLVTAYTRWGKTQLFKLLVRQAIARGDAVIVLDPKGDRGLREAMRSAAGAAGKPLLVFNPAFPAESVTLDPMTNWHEATELATRVSALLGRGDRGDAFTSFAFMQLTNVIHGILLVKRRPTLVRLKQCFDGGMEQLVIDAVTAYCNQVLEPGWATALDSYRRVIVATSKKPKGSGPDDEFANRKLTPEQEAKALIKFYQETVALKRSSPELEGLITTYVHPHDHFQKMIQALMPILTKLTSGTLAELMSSDVREKDETRIATDSARIVEQGQVVYVGLNALGNEEVANAIGEIVLADLAAVCGARYNYSTSKRVVSIFVDEAVEILNEKLILLLNKGGGAQFRLTLAVQGIADIEARLQSAALADKVLNNISNYIFGRCPSPASQKFFVERTPLVPIRSIKQGRSTTTQSADPHAYSAGVTETLEVEKQFAIDEINLAILPKCEYFGILGGNRFVKGKFPVLIE